MYILGKTFGSLFGWLIGGPLGFVLGLGVGHLFDRGLAANMNFNPGNVKTAQEVFFEATFALMGYIAKSDGRVSEKEIQFARQVMTHLQLNQQQKMHAIGLFNRGKSPEFEADEMLDRFVHACGRHPHLVQLFLEFQMQAAFADGVNHQQKRAVLESICSRLGLPPGFMAQVEKGFYAEQSFYNGSSRTGQQSAATPEFELQNAYQVLGIDKSASDSEVKRSYKKLMSQNHPDKLVAKGLPEEMIKMATEKAQHIQRAYQAIAKSRGI